MGGGSLSRAMGLTSGHAIGLQSSVESVQRAPPPGAVWH
jgi:hypothetical protein